MMRMIGRTTAAEVQRFLREEGGQDLVEYSLLIAVLALGALGVIQGMVNGGVTSVLQSTGSALNSAAARSAS